MEQKRKFRLFDQNRDGPGVSRDEGPLIPNLKNMPKFYFRYFTKLLSLNFLMLPLLIIPLIALYIYLVSPTTPSQTSVLYSTLLGSYTLGTSPAIPSLIGVYGVQVNLPVFDAPILCTFAGLTLLLALIWGWVNIGATYCTRGMLKGEPVFLWSDFWYAIKRNLKQGFFIGLIDFVIIFMLGFDIVYFSQVGGSFWLDFFFFAICALCIIYFFMRFYIYLMVVTFDLPIRKILKNALIFSVLGIKRNLMAVLGIAFLIAINALLLLVFWQIGVVVPLILPAIYLLPSVCLFKTYGAFPVIEKYMIKDSE